VNTGTFGLEVDIRPLACGDGHKDGSEECDDGDNLPNDGCAPDCTLEQNFECTQSTPGMPSVCTRRPADGVCGNVQCDAIASSAPEGTARCCTTAQGCGVALTERYGSSCLLRNQPGASDTECADASGGLIGSRNEGSCSAPASRRPTSSGPPHPRPRSL
jgi:cysteine-rich repeat protein